MKTIKLALASLAAFGGFAALASPAAAHSDIHVSLRFGAPPPVAYCPPPAPVVTYCPPPAPVVAGRYHHRPAGHWNEIVVKTWVPARFVTSYDWCGRPVRVVEPGHFAYHTDRVWVSHRG